MKDREVGHEEIVNVFELKEEVVTAPEAEVSKDVDDGDNTKAIEVGDEKVKFRSALTKSST